MRAVLAGLMIFVAAANGAAQPVQKQVLVLQSFERGNLVIDNFTPNFHVELDQRTEQPVNFVQVVVTPTGSAGAPEQAVVDFVRSIFADRPKPDLIVAIAGPASVFLRKYRQQLFPDTPVLFAAVDERYLAGAPLAQNETAVPAVVPFNKILDETLRLLPQTRQVFMIMGSGLHGGFWRRQLEEQFKSFQDRATFVWWDDLSLAEVLRRAESLPVNSALYYVVFGTDAVGSAYADDRVLADLHARANAPLIGAHTAYFGAGILGGSLVSIDELSRRAADMAMQLLNGVPPKSVKASPQPAARPLFDWRELQRWGIPESRLPPGSVVRYRTPSLWTAYRATVLTAAGVLAVQSLLIAGLVYQRRARQRAEFESRKSLELAADATRRQTMSALTNSIAHELGQPLSSMIHNAEALQMMVTANRATPGTIEEILSDIQAQGVQATQIIDRHRKMLRSRQLDIKPIDLHAVINESLALVDHDMRARQIVATVNLPSNRCVISGDHVLLEQVLVNLVVNAMDAMETTPPLRRRLTISSEVRDAVVEVSVRDSGTGVPPEIIDTLFTPFTTTKSHGLGIGLTIVRTILEAHGGTIGVYNNHEGGATFVVTLLRSEASRIESGLSGAA